MITAEALAPTNQIASDVMKDREALKIEASPLDPLIAADGFSGFISTIFVVAAAGAVVFGLIASGSGEPLLLTIIAVLAMLGLFLLFGIAAGHVRIGARMPAGDVLKAAADATDEPQMVARADGSVVYWNPAFETMFGRSDAGPRASLETAVSGDPQAAQALFRLMRAAERGETRREDIRLRATSGGRRPSWIRVTVRPFASPERSADTANPDVLALWNVADVSGEKTREAQKIGNLEAALASFDTMPVGFMSVSGEGAITHINSSFESWLGHDQGTLRARAVKFADVAGDDGAALLKSLAAETEADRRTIDLDLTRADGRIAPLTLFVEASSIGGDGGFTVTAVQRSARNDLSGGGHNEIRFSQFFQSAPFGIATLDAEGRIASCNTAFMRMVLDGRPAHDILATSALCRNAEPDERSAIDAGLAEVLTGRGNVQPIEITGGENKQYSRRVYLSPVSITSGSEAAALYVVDVTEQKALEQRFAQSQKMEAVGNLAGGIAHDFNNVLTAIIGFSDLLLQTHRPSDPAYKDIKNIQSAANRAAGLVANLLGFSRKQTQQVSVLNVDEVIADHMPTLKITVSEKIDLKIHSERDLWCVRADPSQIFNIVLNLVRNAKDAMPTGGKLTIRTRNVTERESQKMSGVVGFMPGEYVLIEVADTGTGMSAEVMAKIFEPFFTTKGVGKGTGLGLASVYGVVKQSGGFIQPESEIGKGTAFKVYLPRYVQTDEEIEAAQPKLLAAAKRNATAMDLTGTGRVLLVEDEVEVRQFAVRALKRQGYQVLEAADGVEALAVMEANQGTVDIVVSDVVMPEMDGPTLFKELRARNPSIKVIFVSGYPNEAFRESLGSDDFAFLPKPFSLPQLAQKVKEELAK
jgi:two-component system, cell cycle sensor histidine kinase and response regulator CckA